MKTWKENPWLFANGRFYLKHDKEIDKIYNFRIEGFRLELLDRFLGLDIGCYFLSSGNRIAIDVNHKLIARKIEDMDNSELVGFFSDEFDQRDFPYWRARAVDIANSGIGRMNTRAFLHCLSIGVYPFDQSHFGKDVIDIKTLED